MKKEPYGGILFEALQPAAMPYIALWRTGVQYEQADMHYLYGRRNIVKKSLNSKGWARCDSYLTIVIKL